MKVAASGETPKISATRSLIALIIYLSYLFTQLLNASFAALSVLAFRTWGDRPQYSLASDEPPVIKLNTFGAKL